MRGRRWVDRVGRVVTRPSDREITSQCLVVEGVPVQFLPAYNSLIEEALEQAQQTTYEDITTRVLRGEYLVAIALQTGRSKDRERVRILREQAQLDMNLLAAVRWLHATDNG